MPFEALNNGREFLARHEASEYAGQRKKLGGTEIWTSIFRVRMDQNHAWPRPEVRDLPLYFQIIWRRCSIVSLYAVKFDWNICMIGKGVKVLRGLVKGTILKVYLKGKLKTTRHVSHIYWQCCRNSKRIPDEHNLESLPPHQRGIRWYVVSSYYVRCKYSSGGNNIVGLWQNSNFMKVCIIYYRAEARLSATEPSSGDFQGADWRYGGRYCRILKVKE